MMKESTDFTDALEDGKHELGIEVTVDSKAVVLRHINELAVAVDLGLIFNSANHDAVVFSAAAVMAGEPTLRLRKYFTVMLPGSCGEIGLFLKGVTKRGWLLSLDNC